jgi:DNA-binding CsgD family transcriptional regulator
MGAAAHRRACRIATRPSKEPPAVPASLEQAAATADRDGQALRLRATGLSYAAIGRQLGVNESTAHRAVERALRRTPREPAADVVALEADRLDQLYSRAVAVLAQAPDDMTRLHAIDRALRVMERRAKLLGLDAPVKVDHRIMDSVDAKLEALAAELGALDEPVMALDDEPAVALGDV